jgi:DNA modification methylase
MKEILIACDVKDHETLENLEEIQGKLKTITPERLSELKGEITETGFAYPMHVWRRPGHKAMILGGHQRLKALQALQADGWGIPPIPVVVVFADNYEMAMRRVLQDVGQYGDVQSQGLFEFMGKAGLSFDDVSVAFKIPDFDMKLFGEAFFPDVPKGDLPDDPESIKLSDRFLVPPFSILDARQGYWKKRKDQWLGLGIKSEVGRAGNLLGMSDTVLEPDPLKRAATGGGSGLESSSYKTFDDGSGGAGTSIFDPVLCEIAYRWFCPEQGLIIDPFAGGSVRGIVASKLNRKYVGIELREEQVVANREQVQKICKENLPTYITGDSRDLSELTKDEPLADLIFSCPPYADLEVYSDDPRDLSTLSYGEFKETYAEIISAAVAKLKENRFACFVVGEVRAKDGFYHGFVQDTISAFEAAGAKLYNEAILVTSLGTLPIRVGRMFTAARKLGKTHQNVLIFLKGDPKIATQECGEILIDDSAFAPESDAALP